MAWRRTRKERFPGDGDVGKSQRSGLLYLKYTNTKDL